jgi:hypothetical protein
LAWAAFFLIAEKRHSILQTKINNQLKIFTMKNIFLVCIVLGLVFNCSAQQMTVNTGTLVVSPNTNFYFAGMTLTPSATFTMSNNILSKDTAVTDTFSSTYVSRTYRFTGSPVFSGTIGIKYQDGELNGLNESSLQLGGYNGSSFQAVGNTTVDSINDYLTSSGITAYPLQELILTTGVALPLRLINVSATRRASVVNLKWETAQEYGVKHYDVQRSTDGVHWTTAISGMPAKNVPYRSVYEAKDVPGFDGLLFYRIRQVDIDGAVFFSRIVTVAGYSTPGSVTIMPNPARDNFVVSGIDQEKIVAVDLSDAAGHLIRQWQQSQSTYELTSLPVGIYYVRIHMVSKNIISKQIIVK